MHFNTTRRVLDFTVDEDKFFTKPAIPAEVVFTLQSVMGELGSAEKGANREAAFDRLKATYRRILSAESYALFEPRVSGECGDDTVPIDAMLLIDITRWVISEGLGKDRSEQSDSSVPG